MQPFAFVADVDGTLMHSRRLLREGDVCVEFIDGEPRGFMRPKVISAILSLPSNSTFSVITTRSAEQYNRISWPGRKPNCAYVANGGLFVSDNRQVESLINIDDSSHIARLEEVANCLVGEKGIRTARVVDNCYTIVLLSEPNCAPDFLEVVSEGAGLNLFVEGKKAYFFPPGLDKAIALCDLRKRYPEKKIVCAGDSRNDIPMLRLSDLAITTQSVVEFAEESFSHSKISTCPHDDLFEDFVGKCISELSESTFCCTNVEDENGDKRDGGRH